MAQMLLRAVDNRALADLRRGVLPVDGRHIVLFARAPHERSGLGSVFRFLGPRLAVTGRVETKCERARREIVYRHSPSDVDHSRLGIIRERTAVVDDHNRWNIGDFAMPLSIRLRPFAPGHIVRRIFRHRYVKIRSFHPFRRGRRAVDRTTVKDRGMHRIEGILQLLYVIALTNITGVVPLAVLADEEMIIGQFGRMPRVHISPNDAAQLTDRIGFERYFVFEGATGGLAGLFDTTPV